MDAQRPQLLNVRQLWHNSFDGVIKHNLKPLTASFTAAFGAAANAAGSPSNAEVNAIVERTPDALKESVRSNMLVLASIAQGFRLRDDARKLGWELNPDFDGELIIARKGGEAIQLNAHTKLTVAGPMLPEIDALRKKHLAWLEALKKEGLTAEDTLAAYVDRSVTNLSSIVALVECKGKSILLTGDARGDRIIEGLELIGRLKAGKVLDVDILKVPHHGSANNLTPDFFKRIVADHYVFSGNGEHGNPEREALEMLFTARAAAASFTVHLTYPIAEIDVARRHEWEEKRADEIANGKKPRPKWSPAKHGVKAFVEKHATAKRTFEIVAEQAAHVIDLHSPLGF